MLGSSCQSILLYQNKALYSLNFVFVFIFLHSSKLSISFFQNKVPCRQGKESLVMKELFKVLKDHDNKFMQDLVTASYQQCVLTVVEGFLSDSESMAVEECGMENVVSVRVIQASFKSIVSEAIDKMMGAKLVIDRYGLDGNSQESQEERTSDSMEPRLGDKLTVLINDISIAMRRLEYTLYRGTVYKKCEGATYIYSYKRDVKAFVNSFLFCSSIKTL